jgi:hypothetical protein
MHGSMHVSGAPIAGKTRGVLVFEGGSSLPLPGGGKIHPFTPRELARSRPAERPCDRPIRHRPSAISLSFSRKTWSLTVSALKIGEI